MDLTCAWARGGGGGVPLWAIVSKELELSPRAQHDLCFGEGWVGGPVGLNLKEAGISSHGSTKKSSSFVCCLSLGGVPLWAIVSDSEELIVSD